MRPILHVVLVVVGPIPYIVFIHSMRKSQSADLESSEAFSSASNSATMNISAMQDFIFRVLDISFLQLCSF